MKKVVIDTSVIIDHTRANKGDLLKIIKSNSQIYIPMIAISELWAGKSMADLEDSKRVENLISVFSKIDMDEGSAKKAGEILRNNSSLGVADAIVAAIALKIGGCVATNNTKHFSKIKNLKLYSK
jgi:predicted nucleic acid-binding protein